MNSSIETLNQLGGRFLTFAWPMFWQTSLLIALVYALDRLLARTVRAAVRHALWLVVLIKLLLPPSLALPTGAAWWLFPAHPPAETPVARNFVVTEDEASSLPVDGPAAIPLAPPRVDRASWVFMSAAAVSLGLMVWLLVRWLQVVRLVGRAAPAEGVASLLEPVRRRAGLRRCLRLKLVEGRTSPAVCGLFRPVILLPRMLAEKLPAEQLQVVVLHEAMHLRRLDIWTNCAQALLQILYWWHPLVWLANARIRRLREEAVDDAVMLALADQAEIYAPTLLEVARLAFRRPLLSLGLVGILESRSALRQRIERLVTFRPPRRAGVSLISLAAISGFGAMALPMGRAPAPASDGFSVPAATATPPLQRLPQVLIQAEIYQMPQGQLQGLVAGLPTAKVDAKGSRSVFLSPEVWWSASPAQYAELSGRLRASGLKPDQRPRILTSSGMPAQVFVGNDQGGLELECRPVVREGKIQLTFTSELTDRTAGAGFTNGIEGEVTLPNHGGLVVPMPDDARHTAFFLTAEIISNKPPALPKDSGAGMNPRSVPAATPEMIKSLIQDGKLLFEMNHFEEAAAKFDAVMAVDSTNATARYYRDIITAAQQRRENEGVNAHQDSLEIRKKTFEKLHRISLPVVTFENMPLNQVAEILAKQSQLLDPDKVGINFQVEPASGATERIDPQSGLPSGRAAGDDADLSRVLVSIHPPLVSSSLEATLDAIVKGASSPISYAIAADGRVIFFSASPSAPLFTRTFKVDPETFWANVQRQTASGEVAASTNSKSSTLRKLFGTAGVNWDTPAGKSVFYNDRLGYLFLKATKEDLDLVEQIVMRLSQPGSWDGGQSEGKGKIDQSAAGHGPPQVHIKARFIEVRQPESGDSGFDWYLGQFDLDKLTDPQGTRRESPGPSGFGARSAGGLTGLLTQPDFQVLLRALQTGHDVEALGEPEMTLLSGRQARMRTTEIQTIVTNVAFYDQFTNRDGTISKDAFEPQTMALETGPVLDFTAQVLDDGYTFDLSATASLTEFLGYASVPSHAVGHDVMRAVTNAAGVKLGAPLVWPAAQRCSQSMRARLYDDQTVVFTLDPARAQALTFSAPDDWRDALVAEHIRDSRKNRGKSIVFVFVTPTMVDEAGRRFHTDDQLLVLLC